MVWRALFHGRRSSDGNLLGGVNAPPRGPKALRSPRLYKEPLEQGSGEPRDSYHPPMFSYRHAFHAGNHADVLKHTVLIATLDHLLEKDAALTVVDTHAGAGLYRLDGDYAGTSGEAADGVLCLVADPQSAAANPSAAKGAKKGAEEPPQPLAGA